MISDRLMEAIQDLRDTGIMDHGQVSSWGECESCPAEAYFPSACECGAKEHNQDVLNAYERILKILDEEEKNIYTLPKKPLDCHGISIPDSMVIVGKSDIQ